MMEIDKWGITRFTYKCCRGHGKSKTGGEQGWEGESQ